MDHNPHLRSPDLATNKGQSDGIEVPARVENIAWQTRAASLTPAENALADALQAIFADEVYDLPGIVGRLNAAGLAAPAGEARWTEANFRAELARLAA